MRRLLYILVLNLFAAFSFAQESKKEEVEEKVYTITEEMPEYPGGIQEARTFIAREMKYPQIARERSLGGKVILKFVIDIDGKVKDVTVARSTGVSILDEEAVRVVKSMPNWRPGKSNGVPVRVYYNIPITFNIDGPYFIINPNNSNPDYQKGNVLVLSGNAKIAKDYYAKSIEDADALFNLGVICYNEKNLEASSEYFRKVLLVSYDKLNYTYVTSDRFLNNYFKSK